MIDSLTKDEAERPGYYAEGWSAKDALGHIGAWLAEAGLMLEQIAAGTYKRHEIDVEAMNQTFLDALRDLPFDAARAQASAARARMLLALRALPEVTEDALWWVSKAGPEHYHEHIPRMRDWIGELRKGGLRK